MQSGDERSSTLRPGRPGAKLIEKDRDVISSQVRLFLLWMIGDQMMVSRNKGK